jgi:hypothetical protein
MEDLHIVTEQDFHDQYSNDPLVKKKGKKPHVIRDNNFVKIKDLKVGQIFYPDYDIFVFFSTVNKRYVEKFENDRAIVQCIACDENKNWVFNIKTEYKLDDEVYVSIGEHISIW